ncbi:MAG: beta-Ala-His dipeptidase [Acidobacteriota bacterium]
MTSPLSGLEPALVWRHFDDLRRIPRPSKQEERVLRHLDTWAEAQGFSVRRDAAGNRVIAVPATEGRGEAPTVVLQAHVDMVCEKNRGVDFDFETQPIEVTVDGDWVRARGTTLGADNGIGAAMALAAASDPAAPHGPLELLMTVDEETGLNGAAALDPSIVEGRLLVNLDTEEEGAIYVGCAGAAGVEGRLTVARDDGGGEPYELAVTGLSGGHSGMDIHTNRGNAVVILAHLLEAALGAGADFGLVRFQGGDKANAIPREAFAEVRLNPAGRSTLETILADRRPTLLERYGATDPRLRVELRPAPEPSPWQPLTNDDRDRWLRLLTAAPHGVLAMSTDVPGLVETSNNLALAQLGEDGGHVVCAMRSSSNPALGDAGQSIAALMALAGADVHRREGYPGWTPNPSSPLLARTVAVHADLFGEPPEVKGIHAGLECGILAAKLHGLDAVSFGPDIRGAHSPDERVSIGAVARSQRLLLALLDALSA